MTKKVTVSATGFDWPNGKFRDSLILPQTPDFTDELEAGALRVTPAFGLEIYNGTVWLPIAGSSNGAGSYKLYGQLVVGGAGSGIVDGDTIYQNNALIGLFVDVFHQGANLCTNLEDRLSYTYNILTGEITFNSPLAAGEVLRIYTFNSAETSGGIIAVDTYADIDASGLPHFIQVHADEQLQDPGETAPISLYYWNGSELVLVVSKVYIPAGPDPDLGLTFTERVGITQDGANYTGAVVPDGTALYYHYGLCDYKLAGGSDGSITFDIGTESSPSFMGMRTDDVNGHYNEFSNFLLINGGNYYSTPDDPIGVMTVGDKVRLRRTSDILYIDLYNSGAWAQIYEIGSLPGDLFIGISMNEGKTIYNPIGENLILK